MTDYNEIMKKIDEAKARQASGDLSVIAYDLVNKLIVAECKDAPPSWQKVLEHLKTIPIPSMEKLLSGETTIFYAEAVYDFLTKSNK
jgi:hypothetical protein